MSDPVLRRAGDRRTVALPTLGWPIVIIVCFVCACLTTLIALGRDVAALVELILLLTTTGTLGASAYAAHASQRVAHNVNGQFTRLLDAAGVPRADDDDRPPLPPEPGT